jgi:hypothetical protein
VGPGRGDAGRLVVMNYAVTFVDIASTRVAVLQTVLTTVLTAEHAVLVPILKALLGIFIGRQFFLVMFGHMTMDRFWNSVIRALVIVFLVANATNFNQWVATKMFTNIPQALTSLGVGSYAPTSAGQSSAAQFDSVSAAGDAIAAQIVAKSSIWSVSSASGCLVSACCPSRSAWGRPFCASNSSTARAALLINGSESWWALQPSVLPRRSSWRCRCKASRPH